MIKGYLEKNLTTVEGEQKLVVDLSIQKGELVVVYGSSGVGKTTLLRMLAGLTTADQGELYVNNECWFNTTKKINYSPQQRRVGMVFQDYALFPNMTVLQNLEFAAKNKKLIKELLYATGLEQLKDCRPQMLSGGQQQRVALARALVMQPKLLLLDEPLSALDLHMRNQLQQLILELHQHYQMTTLMVSHDVQEVFKMADKVLLLEYGQVATFGRPKVVLENKGIRVPLVFTAKIIGIEGEWVKIQVGEQIKNIHKNRLNKDRVKVGQLVKLEVL